MLPLIRSRGAAAGGPNLGWAVRDSPNVIVPTLAVPAAVALGVNWAWPASWSQVVASLGYEFLLNQVQIAPGLGIQVSANGSQHMRIHEHLQIGLGAGNPAAAAAEASLADGAYMAVSEIVDFGAEGTVLIVMGGHRSIPIGPVVIPAATRIAGRTTVSGSPTFTATRLYLMGYDTSALTFVSVPYFDEDFERGLKACYSALLPLASSVSVSGPAASWTWGQWTQISAGLDADYLVKKMSVTPPATAGTGANAQFELALTEDYVVQARGSNMYVGGAMGSGVTEWKYPFYAQEGEPLYCRAAQTSAAARTFEVVVEGTRLN